MAAVIRHQVLFQEQVMLTSHTRGKVARTSATKEINCTISCDLHRTGKKARGSTSLRRILRYKNEAVIVKIMSKLKLSREDAVILFEDTLRFLWLSDKFGGLAPPGPIDEGWHTLILFTMDYQKFCHKYFGRFLHHRPNRPEDPPIDKPAMTNRLHALVAEHLGDELSANWELKKKEHEHKCCGSGGHCREYCKCGG